MAVYDNSAQLSGFTPSFTVTTLPNRVLLLFITSGNDVTGVTYAGVSMTQLEDATDYNNQHYSLWYLKAPATGSNSFAFTGGGDFFEMMAYSYYNAGQTASPDNNVGTTQTSATPSTTITPNSDNCIILGCVCSYHTASITSPTLHPLSYSNSGQPAALNTADSAEQATTNPFTVSGTASASFKSVILAVSIANQNSTYTSSPSESMMNAVSRYATVTRGFFRSLSETMMNAASRFCTVAFERFPAEVLSLGASIIVAAYKWMTTTLYAAQQSLVVRSYFTVEIHDDTLQAQDQLTVESAPAYGKTVLAPDGNIVGVGHSYGNAGYNAFYKIANGTLGSNNWSANGLYDPIPNSQGHVDPNFSSTIAVSGWYQGSYLIDVYYRNLPTSANAQIRHSYSVNGGLTWADELVATLPYTSSSGYVTAVPFSISAGKPILLPNGQIQRVVFWTDAYANGNYPSGTPPVWTPTTNLTFTIQYALNTGSGWSSITDWSYAYGAYTGSKNIDSGDWTIHSIDSYYFGGVYHLILSAFHNMYETVNSTPQASGGNTLIGVTPNILPPGYSLYHTVARVLTGTVATDLWDEATEIVPSQASTGANLNSFILPQVNCLEDGVNIWIVAKGQVTTSIQQTAQTQNSMGSSQLVSAQQNFYLFQSQDGLNFSYPFPILDNAGNPFNDYNSYLTTLGRTIKDACGFVYQNGYYFVAGGIPNNVSVLTGNIFNYQVQNVTANVTNDVLNYSIQEDSGQPSSITVTIANANGKWVGSSPTGVGYQAIQGNRKIFLSQGYYNSSGLPETVPKDIFYIDDVQQNVTSTNNDLVVSGRNVYKPLLVTTSKYTYNWHGPIFYTDVFDGTTLGNWNQVAGTWVEANDQMNPATTSGYDSSTPTPKAIISLSNTQITTPNSMMAVTFTLPPDNTQGFAYIYPYFQDQNNWLRVSFANNGSYHVVWSIDYMVNGVLNNGGSSLDSGNYVHSNQNATFPNFTIYIRRHDWYYFNFILGSNGAPPGSAGSSPASQSGNTIAIFGLTAAGFAYPTLLGSPDSGGTNGGDYAFPLWTAIANTVDLVPATVALGATQYSTGSVNFSYFKYAQFDNSLGIDDATKLLASKASVFSYNTEKSLQEGMYTPANWSGTFSIPNRNLTITAGNYAVYTPSTLSNATIEFDAKVSGTNPDANFGFQLMVRGASNITSGYFWDNSMLSQGGAANYTVSSLYVKTTGGLDYSSGNYLLASSGLGALIPLPTGSPTYVDNLNLNLSGWHHYKFIMQNGWLYGFIDGIMVMACNDNNVTQVYYETGSFGFVADSNSTVEVKNIFCPALAQQLPTLSFNPNDDVSDTFIQVLQSIFGWYFSDLLGRLKTVLIRSTDPSNYTYNGIIIQQQTDASNKEYYNEVTVYGTNVQATAQDSALIASTGSVRAYVIVDFSITTQQDAQTRANQELANAEINNFQNTTTMNNNPGSELFDVVTVINTGPNTSGVSGTARIYNQTESAGSGNNSTGYTITIQTGDVGPPGT